MTWTSKQVFDLDATHPLPAALSSTHKPKSYVTLMASGIILPAKESYAKMKTFTQSQCHDSSCGDAGNWQGTDDALAKQSNKIQ